MLLWVSILFPCGFLKDYINFSLARHSFSLKRLVEAKQAFEKLFMHRSLQLTFQQETNIKEYIFIHKVSECTFCMGDISINAISCSKC